MERSGRARRLASAAAVVRVGGGGRQGRAIRMGLDDDRGCWFGYGEER